MPMLGAVPPPAECHVVYIRHAGSPQPSRGQGRNPIALRVGMTFSQVLRFISDLASSGGTRGCDVYAV